MMDLSDVLKKKKYKSKSELEEKSGTPMTILNKLKKVNPYSSVLEERGLGLSTLDQVRANKQAQENAMGSSGMLERPSAFEKDDKEKEGLYDEKKKKINKAKLEMLIKARIKK